MNKFFSFIETIVRFFIYKVFRMKLSEENFDKFMQFVKFAFVGLSNSLIYYVFYLISLNLINKGCQVQKHIELGLHVQIANFIGFTISVFNAFYWSNNYVFTDGKGDRSLVKTFIKTYISYAGTGLILAALLLILWIQILGLPEFLGPILNLFVTVPLNFIINKFWAYKDHSEHT
ncbi:MAG: GtrA family protein [Lachnospiraceae bacterium]|nr:GtrA family protein [Lachnospiraceae bacterium]